MNRGKVILYDHIPDDVYQLLMNKKAEMSAKLKKNVSVSYVITKLLRHHGQTSEQTQSEHR